MRVPSPNHWTTREFPVTISWNVPIQLAFNCLSPFSSKYFLKKCLEIYSSFIHQSTVINALINTSVKKVLNKLHLYPGSWPPTSNFGKNVYLYIVFGNIYYGGELGMTEIKLPREVLRKLTSPIWTKTIRYQHQLMRCTNMYEHVSCIDHPFWVLLDWDPKLCPVPVQFQCHRTWMSASTSDISGHLYVRMECQSW